jgi:hypothetical protein
MLSVGNLYSTEAFFSELEKIAGYKEKAFSLLEKAKLIEPAHVAAKRTVKKLSKGVSGPSPEVLAQLKEMKLQKQLDALKAARGL